MENPTRSLNTPGDLEGPPSLRLSGQNKIEGLPKILYTTPRDLIPDCSALSGGPVMVLVLAASDRWEGGGKVFSGRVLPLTWERSLHGRCI